MVTPERGYGDDAANLLKAELGLQSQGNGSVEEQTAAMFEAVLIKARSSGVVDDFIGKLARSTIIDRGLSAGAAASDFRSILIDYFDTRYDEEGEVFNDEDLKEASDWESNMNLLEATLYDYNGRSAAILAADYLMWPLTATSARGRIVAPEMIGNLTWDRTLNGALVLDVGGGISTGVLNVAYKDEVALLPFKSLVDPQGRDLSGKANEIKDGPSRFRKIISIDKSIVYYEDRQRFDEGRKKFALNGRKPSERASKKYTDVDKFLIGKKDSTNPEGYDSLSKDRVLMKTFDLLNPHDLGIFKEQHPDPFDMIIASFVTQEMSPSDQIKMHGILCNLLSWNGLIIYLHQARIDQASDKPVPIDKVRHYSTYASNEYRTYMHLVDALASPTGVKQTINFRDNRCLEGRLCDSTIVVNGKPEPITDLIKNA